jgi:hypothetical protein
MKIFSVKEQPIPRLITDIKDEARQWFIAGAKDLGPIVGLPMPRVVGLFRAGLVFRFWANLAKKIGMYYM